MSTNGNGIVRNYAPVDPAQPSSQPKKVAYFYDSDVGNYAYNAGHPMKPHRIRMAHSLIMNYNLYKHLEIYRAKPASKYEMTQFHTDEYVDFLQRVTPDNMEQFGREQGKYNVGDDCPVFDGLFEFCGISAGGSMEGAARLNRGKCDVAVNWAGGLHHAKKSEASGFCYINGVLPPHTTALSTFDCLLTRWICRYRSGHPGAAPLPSPCPLYRYRCPPRRRRRGSILRY